MKPDPRCLLCDGELRFLLTASHSGLCKVCSAMNYNGKVQLSVGYFVIQGNRKGFTVSIVSTGGARSEETVVEGVDVRLVKGLSVEVLQTFYDYGGWDRLKKIGPLK